MANTKKLSDDERRENLLESYSKYNKKRKQ